MRRKTVSGIMLTLLFMGMLTLAFDVQPIGAELLFFDDFNDGVADGWTEQVGVGVWQVINGEYYADDPVGSPNPDGVITTVDNLNLSDFTMSVDFRTGTKEAGFWQGFVFRYTDKYHHYVAIVSDEYDMMGIAKMTPDAYHGGVGINATENYAVPISPGIIYSLKLTVSGTKFYVYLNDELKLTGSDDEYTSGLVGLRVQGSDCYFDNFTVWLSPPVGGVYIPVNKLELLAPYIALTTLLAVAVIAVGYVKKRKRAARIDS